MKASLRACLAAALLAATVGIAAARQLKQDCASGAAGISCFCSAREKPGYYADLSSGCKAYYWCLGGDQGSFHECGEQTLFNEAIGFCDYATKVQCGGAPAARPDTPTQAEPAAAAGGSVGEGQTQPQVPAAEPAPKPEGQPSEAASAPAPASASCTSTEDRPPGTTGVEALISPKLWCELFVHSGDEVCSPAFYTYQAFVAAAGAFPGFATSSPDEATNRRELAAFLAQVSHETTGGPATNNLYDWGLCFKEEVGAPSNYCVEDPEWPCAANASYHGRGPVQLSYNFNYGQVGKALGIDLLQHPELVTDNGTIAFETALWFWMTPQPPKPSAHDVMAGRYEPSDDDKKAERWGGFGLTINIINGGLECGPENAQKESAAAKAADRIAYFKRYAGLLGVDPGENLDCSSQLPYAAAPVPGAGR